MRGASGLTVHEREDLRPSWRTGTASKLHVSMELTRIDVSTAHQHSVMHLGQLLRRGSDVCKRCRGSMIGSCLTCSTGRSRTAGLCRVQRTLSACSLLVGSVARVGIAVSKRMGACPARGASAVRRTVSESRTHHTDPLLLTCSACFAEVHPAFAAAVPVQAQLQSVHLRP